MRQTEQSASASERMEKRMANLREQIDLFDQLMAAVEDPDRGPRYKMVNRCCRFPNGATVDFDEVEAARDEFTRLADNAGGKFDLRVVYAWNHYISLTRPMWMCSNPQCLRKDGQFVEREEGHVYICASCEIGTPV